MPQAIIVFAAKRGGYAHASFRVANDDPDGAVEYHVKTPLLDAQGQAKSNQTLKAELIDLARAKRDAQQAPAQTNVPIVGDTVEL